MRSIREAKVILYTSTEVVLFDPGRDLDSELLVFSGIKHLKLTYAPERNTVRFETAKESAFEARSGVVAPLAATLMQLLHRR